MTKEEFGKKREEVNKKIKEKYDDYKGKIKMVPVYIEKSGDAVTEFLKDKRTKFYVAITFFIQAVTFAVIFFAMWEKKKSLSGLFAALAAASAAAGSLLLVSSLDEDENGKKTLLHFDGCYDGEDDDEDVSIEFTEDEAGEEAEEEAGDEEIVTGEEDK